ncbi:MAG: glycosyltransferase family 4 protein [Planctomycetaceae bacterium]|nr:glycosyltransferase family 4 protein [Planctomycetaceae bacterium]
MRILFLTHYYPPEVNAPASRTSEHCLRWAAAGHDVTVVTCAPNCPDGVVFDGYRNRLRRQVETVDGVRVMRVWTYVAPNSGTIRRIANYVSYMLSAIWTCLWLSRPDVVIATSPQFFCGWAGVWVSRLKRVPFVLEIRDIWPESIQAVGAMQGGPVVRFLEWLERRMYLAADHIVTVGAGYKDRIAEKVPVSDHVSVIMNGVDLEKFSPSQVEGVDAFRREWNLEDRFVCSYIGTIGMAHGLEVVIEAAERLRDEGRNDVSFLLVGDGARKSELEATVRDRGLSEWVVFTGRQPREMMPTVLAVSDACLVHLRATELFGTVIPSKIFETMAMARPIIMGVRGEALEIVKRANAGIEMQPESADSLLDAIKHFTDDNHNAESMGQAARKYVAEHFSRDSMAQSYLELLIDLVEGKDQTDPQDDSRPESRDAVQRESSMHEAAVLAEPSGRSR